MPARVAPSFGAVIVQIMLLDIVFSLDSVITAVGMADRPGGDGAAVMIAVGIMMLSAASISRFVERHPTVKVLALSFLLLIGVSLVAEGLRHAHPQGLHLLRDGVLGVRRDDQSPGGEEAQGRTGEAARALLSTAQRVGSSIAAMAVARDSGSVPRSTARGTVRSARVR